jgi:hypothetical protein
MLNGCGLKKLCTDEIDVRVWRQLQKTFYILKFPGSEKHTEIDTGGYENEPPEALRSRTTN